jgi:hypothetical protein
MPEPMSAILLRAMSGNIPLSDAGPKRQDEPRGQADKPELRQRLSLDANQDQLIIFTSTFSIV